MRREKIDLKMKSSSKHALEATIYDNAVMKLKQYCSCLADSNT